MEQRALALDEEELPTALDPLEHEPFGGARDEVGHDRVDGDAPSGDRDPGLPGRDELTRDSTAPRLAVELERHGHLPDRAVGADREDGRRVVRQVRPRRNIEPRRRFAQVTQLDAVLACERDQLVVLGDELVQPVLHVEPGADRVLQQLAPCRREAAALRRDAHQRTRRLVLQRLVDAAHDRKAVLGVTRGARAVEQRDNMLGAVAHHAPRGLAVVRVGRPALGEDEEPTRGQRQVPDGSREVAPRRRTALRATGRARGAGCRRGRCGP